jgi:hypothetical protein
MREAELGEQRRAGCPPLEMKIRMLAEVEGIQPGHPRGATVQAAAVREVPGAVRAPGLPLHSESGQSILGGTTWDEGRRVLRLPEADRLRRPGGAPRPPERRTRGPDGCGAPVRRRPESRPRRPALDLAIRTAGDDCEVTQCMFSLSASS